MLEQYVVPSRTTTERHLVTVVDRRAAACTCRGFTNRGTCAHLSLVDEAPYGTYERFTPGNEPVVLPMLAKPWDSFKMTIKPGMFTGEEKFDGHRIVVRVRENGTLAAWSRTGKECLDKLTQDAQEFFSRLPAGVYDGEVIVRDDNSAKSYGVSTLTNRKRLVVVVFDLLETLGKSCTHLQRRERREMLDLVFGRQQPSESVREALVHPINSMDDIRGLARSVWEVYGEGVIIKLETAPYTPGKRPNAWWKLKQAHGAVLQVVGFEESSGTIVDRGPYAITLLKDDDGNTCRVKTLDDETLLHLERVHTSLDSPHPYIGRRLRIEYHERTPGGGYREPRWDRWEDQ